MSSTNNNIDIISSVANPRIKEIRKLRNKKYRQQAGVFFAEGLRVVGEAIHQNADIICLVYSTELLQSEFGKEIINSQTQNQFEILKVSKNVFESISNKDTPQGIGAVLYQRFFHLEKMNELKGTWVAIEGIQDPGNLGSILRTMDAIGANGFILLDDTTDPYHPTAIKASMGAIFTIPIVATKKEDFKLFIKQHPIQIIGTVCQNARDYRTIEFPKDMILLMGSEQKGLSKDLLSVCDELVHIPMIGTVDSLNISNAAAIFLYEIFSNHHKVFL